MMQTQFPKTANSKIMKVLYTTLFLISSLLLSAQISKPSLSPRMTSEQQVGMVKVNLNYGQPNKQNRKVFGGLIPYNKIWRTGANASTKISFSRDVQLAGHVIPEGTYGLYTIPEENQWTIIIHKNSKLWGSAGYDQNNDLVRFTTPVIKKKDTEETLSIKFENFNTTGGDLVISWENSKVSIPLFADSDEAIFQEIVTKINNATDPVKAQTYFDAAQFYALKEKDLDTAMQWYDKAIELKPTAFWFVYYKAELAYHLKDYTTAKTNAEKSLSAAKQSKSSDYGYVAKNELLLKLIADPRN